MPIGPFIPLCVIVPYQIIGYSAAMLIQTLISLAQNRDFLNLVPIQTSIYLAQIPVPFIGILMLFAAKPY